MLAEEMRSSSLHQLKLNNLFLSAIIIQWKALTYLLSETQAVTLQCTFKTNLSLT